MPDAYGQSEEDGRLLAEMLQVLSQWEPYHQRWCRKANHFYSLYRNYQDLKTSLTTTTSDRGKDAVLSDAQGEFGKELFIPMCFSTVETIIPAMLTNSPPMDVQPRTRTSETNVSHVKALLEAQQEEAKFPLKLQTVGKDGLITGTGVGKTWWRRDYQVKQQIVNSSEPGGGLVTTRALKMCYDDPDFEAVDPQDFITDPFGDRIENVDGAFHRAWRSNAYVKRMRDTKQWRNLDAVEDIAGLTDATKYSEVWNERTRAGDQVNTEAGTPSSVSGERAAVHEVLEYWDGDRVVTILDRKIIVASGPNPNWHGLLPFQVYRPTEDPHRLRGIGEIEPIEQLQEELNTLRTQRRYNADLVLQRVFAYHEGVVDREQIQFGPGYAIGVNGDPRELIFPIQVGDIPHSSYEEEDRISADADRTSGISDVIAGAGLSGGGDTATGVQMGYSAASRRIENKLMRLELEVINPAASQFVAMSQQRIITNREIPIPQPPSAGEPERRWSWMELGPQELMGEFSVRCLSRGTAPENIPQNRADAQMGSTLLKGDPVVDQRKLAEWTLENLGVKNPTDWLAPPAPTVPAEVLNRLVEMGVPDKVIAEALAAAGGPDLLGGAGTNEPAQAGEGATPVDGAPAPGQVAEEETPEPEPAAAA